MCGSASCACSALFISGGGRHTFDSQLFVLKKRFTSGQLFPFCTGRYVWNRNSPSGKRQNKLRSSSLQWAWPACATLCANISSMTAWLPSLPKEKWRGGNSGYSVRVLRQFAPIAVGIVGWHCEFVLISWRFTYFFIRRLTTCHLKNRRMSWSGQHDLQSVQSWNGLNCLARFRRENCRSLGKMQTEKWLPNTCILINVHIPYSIF